MLPNIAGRENGLLASQLSDIQPTGGHACVMTLSAHHEHRLDEPIEVRGILGGGAFRKHEKLDAGNQRQRQKPPDVG